MIFSSTVMKYAVNGNIRRSHTFHLRSRDELYIMAVHQKELYSRIFMIFQVNAICF